MFLLKWAEAVDKMVDHLSRNNCYPKYTFIKRGVYYLSKRVPNDLKHHYKTERITQSLKTKSQHQASRSAAILVSKLEDYWINVRLSEAIVPASHLMNDSPRKAKQPKLPTIWKRACGDFITVIRLLTADRDFFSVLNKHQSFAKIYTNSIKNQIA